MDTYFGDRYTSYKRIGHFRGKYKKIYLAIMAVWIPIILLLITANVLADQSTKSIELRMAQKNAIYHGLYNK